SGQLRDRDTAGARAPRYPGDTATVLSSRVSLRTKYSLVCSATTVFGSVLTKSRCGPAVRNSRRTRERVVKRPPRGAGVGGARPRPRHSPSGNGGTVRDQASRARQAAMTLRTVPASKSASQLAQWNGPLSFTSSVNRPIGAAG